MAMPEAPVPHLREVVVLETTTKYSVDLHVQMASIEISKLTTQLLVIDDIIPQ